jgi:PAS domain S-box-containing protein
LTRVAASGPTFSLDGALLALAPGGHVCSIYENELEHLELIVPFVRIGLERGERCVYVAEEGSEGHIEQALSAAGIDVAAALETKALVLMSPKQAYLKGDSFDPYRMFTFWKALSSRASEEGFSRLRGASDMQWILRGAPGAQRWLAYERQLTQLAADGQCLILCQYHRPNFRAEHLLDVIRTHPQVIHRGTVAQNIYYQPSDVVSQAELHAPELESLLNDLRKREHVDYVLRQQREEDQRRTERRLNVALASSTVAFTVLAAVRNEAGRIIDFSWQYANPEAGRIIGRNPLELIGKQIREVLPDAWGPPGLFESYVHVVDTGEQAVIEAGFTRNGVSTWWQNIAARLDDGVAVWFPEITERKRAADEVRRSEAYLADGQRISHTGSWVWDVASQEISFWSLEHFRIFGLDPKVKPTYQLVRPLIHPDDIDFIEENFARAVREHVAYDHEFRILRGDGQLRHLRSVARPVFDGRGTLIEYAGTIVDRTEQKLAEATLRATQSELVRVSRLTTLGELTASIAHEVNQPLAAIIAHGGAARRWLGRSSPNLDEAVRAIEGVIENARRAHDVIARIRALARKANNERELLDLNEIIREILALTDGELRQNSVTLRTDFDPTLPRTFGDRVQLQQVTLNLVMNGVEAICALTEGPRELVVRTSLNDRQELHVAVRDSGVGLPEVELQTIFEPFYTTKPQGMGIGLSISRSIVRAHNGGLWAERNKEASGITVHFTLPVRDGFAGEADPGAPRA